MFEDSLRFSGLQDSSDQCRIFSPASESSRWVFEVISCGVFLDRVVATRFSEIIVYAGHLYYSVYRKRIMRNGVSFDLFFWRATKFTKSY